MEINENNDASDGITMKQCSKCKEWKDATPEFFTRNRGNKSGFDACCKKCKNDARRKPIVEIEHVPEGMKRCFQCSVVFPATIEVFGTNRHYADELNYRCKECYNGTRREKYPAKRRRETLPRGHKRCTGPCQQVFPDTTEFFFDNGTYRGEKIRRSACKTCHNARSMSFYYAHIEYMKIFRREHREEQNKKNRQYRKEHRDELNARHRAYTKTPQGRRIYRALKLKRRALKKAIPGNLSAVQIQAKLKAQKYRCYYGACGHAKFEKKDSNYIYHIEHTVPISRTELKPRHDQDFTVLACPACNHSKGNKTPWEWVEGGRLF